MAAHRASASGSVAGRFAFIGNPVRGRLRVSFQSAMYICQLYRIKAGRPGGRPAPQINPGSAPDSRNLADDDLEVALVVLETVVVHAEEQHAVARSDDRALVADRERRAIA